MPAPEDKQCRAFVNRLVISGQTTPATASASAFEPGDIVERRYGHAESRTGRITGRVREGYDTWYVTCDIGMTFCDNGRDLRPVPTGADRQPLS